ncbi:MAG TPA: UbiA family prenyltransferase [Nitrososphaerales archaeon]|nr:UbiA family prenyltransferase [Nitrososphaerales archaeon]
MIFVWALAVAYLVASKLEPNYETLALLVISGYFLVLGIYFLSDIADIEYDRINSPNRPLASGRVKTRHAEIIAVSLISASLLAVSMVNAATLSLFVVFLLLGLSYSIPRANVKRIFPLKAVVPSSGAAVITLAGGLAAQGLRPVVFFIAIAFALFALVTLLLGDIADLKGDSRTGVRSFPIVIGPKNSVLFVMTIPIIIGGLGVAFFQLAQLNIAFPILLICFCAYSSITMRPLLSRYEEPEVCRRVKSRMRIAHFLMQFIFLLGILAI